MVATCFTALAQSSQLAFSPGTYRVRHDASVADLAVERLDEYERRIVCGGRSHRIVTVAQNASFRIEVDGKAHRIVRDDGGVVRAGWPAFVVSVLVQPGDQVEEHTPILVLESMKMESTVVAPFAGEIASVAVFFASNESSAVTGTVLPVDGGRLAATPGQVAHCDGVELDTRATTGVTYWEGSQRVTATRAGRPVGGQAYVELTGYAKAGN